MKFAVVVFPGSNSDYDAFYAASRVLGEQAELVWHKDTDLKGADAVILPGGFAHGDYLRTGAIARFSPIMAAVKAFADRGGPVLGICNGFQVLLEAGLLPGAMVRNDRHQVRVAASCRCASSRPTRRSPPRARRSRCCSCRSRTAKATTTRRPTCSRELEANRQVIFRYTNAAGEVGDECESERLAQQHRRHLQPRSATSSA